MLKTFINSFVFGFIVTMLTVSVVAAMFVEPDPRITVQVNGKTIEAECYETDHNVVMCDIVDVDSFQNR